MRSRKRALFLIENISFTFDPRSRAEVETLVNNGWKVSVICPKAKGEKYFSIDGGAFVYHYPKPEFSSGIFNYFIEYPVALVLTFFWSLYALLRRGFKIIHARNPPDLFFVIGWFYKLFGKRFIYDQHDVCPELYRSRFENPSKKISKLLQRLEKIQVGTADCILTVNDSLKERMHKFHSSSKGKVLVVRNPAAPVSMRVADRKKREFRDNGIFTVGYIGMMNPQDGVELIVKSADYLINRKGREDLRFVLVGDGAIRCQVEELAKSLGLGEKITFRGYLAGDSFVEALESFDIGVQPDPKNEMNNYMSSCKAMDYMIAGIPIVAFDLLETRRMCGAAALYAKPNDVQSLAEKIERLVEDDDLRSKMGAIGRQRIEEYLSWEKQGIRLLSAYYYILQARRRRGSIIDID